MGLSFAVMVSSWIKIQTMPPNIQHSESPVCELKETQKTPTSKASSPRLYQLVASEDFNYHTPAGRLIRRKDYRVMLLNKNVTRDQIKIIAETISSWDSEINALIVYFYWPDTDTTSAYTAAMATYAPNGCWADARENAPKKIVMQYAQANEGITPKYNTSLSIDERKRIFWALVVEEDRDTSEDAYPARRKVAQRFGLSVEEISKISLEGISKNWPMPKAPSR